MSILSTCRHCAFDFSLKPTYITINIVNETRSYHKPTMYEHLWCLMFISWYDSSLSSYLIQILLFLLSSFWAEIVFFILYLYTKSMPTTFSSVFRVWNARVFCKYGCYSTVGEWNISRKEILVIALDDDTNCQTGSSVDMMLVNSFKSYPENWLKEGW